MHEGTGPGLSNRRLGEKGGQEEVTLTTNQIPSHTHQIRASDQEAKSANPQNNIPAKPADSSGQDVRAYGPTQDEDVVMAGNMCTNTGGSQAHNNLQPYQVINFCIALTGIFPSRG